MCKRFGPFVFGIDLVVEKNELHLVLKNWSLWVTPLPICLAPKVVSFETEHNGRFQFFVEIAHRFTGLIVRYQGWLESPA